MLLNTIRGSFFRRGLEFFRRARTINRRCTCSTIGILFLLAGSAHHAFAEEPDTESKRVLLLYHSLPNNLVYAKTIRAELERQMPGSVELYDAPLLPASNESAEAQYADYLYARFHDQKARPCCSYRRPCDERVPPIS